MEDKWIPVEENLPHCVCKVICQSVKGSIFVGKYCGAFPWSDEKENIFYNCNGILVKVVAWRPLPEPYEPEGK